MDFARPASYARQKKLRRLGIALVGLLFIVSVSVALGRLQPAAPTVEAATLWRDTVKRGSMLRQVRGLGTLVPEDIRWIPATTQGRVEEIVLRPGTTVKRDSVILELSNPELEQELQEAELQLQSAEASLANLRVQMQNALLQQRATTASIEADYHKASMQQQMNEALAADGLVSDLQLKQSQIEAQQLAIRLEIAREQLESQAESSRAQILVQQSAVDQARALLQLKRQQRDELKVRSSLEGVLQIVPVEVGQQVQPGTNLARVANPARLKAEIKIAETQAKDIQIGQRAEIDTRNGIVPGRVTRIDPSVQNGTRTVDVTLDGELPRGAVPDLSVDGTILLERLDDVLYVGRPAFGQEHGVITLFRQDNGGTGAERVQVRLGRSSVNTVEVVEGLGSAPLRGIFH
jgi:HlyD family secretion protein